MLEALSEFRSKKTSAVLATLMSAQNPDEAYRVACEYKGMLTFVREAEANVKVGGAAMELLEEEEMNK